MSRLVVVVPLKDGARDQARSLLAQGPPFELAATDFDRHDVYLTGQEIIFIFESPGPSATLELPAENPALWGAAAEWEKLMAGRPRKAETLYSWARPDDGDAIFYEPTPGPGDSEGGDLFSPVGGQQAKPLTGHGPE